MDKKKHSGRKPHANKKWIAAGGLLAVILLLAVLVWLPKQPQVQPETVTLSELAGDIRLGKVKSIQDNLLLGEFTVTYEDGSTKNGLRDPQASLLEQLNLLDLPGSRLARLQIEVVKGKQSLANTPGGMVFTLMLISTPFIAAFYLARRDRFSKKTFRSADVPTTRFNEVAGLDENLNELQDIVTFLKEGNRYAEMGAKMPRGILMVGDPGTGKTLVARALAGEAGVPFFATSGSEFVEVFVGVGASRMRSLFQKARKHAPCIVFIDEIDAVGRARHRSESGAEMEQDQTLNQLLVEMDGFSGAEGVVVLAATNRVDVLDSALTRAGRFDRRIHVHRPDVRGREAILAVHVQGKRLEPGVSLSVVAKSTPGLVGADLANIVNEAAISAVRNDHDEIGMRDFEEAVEKILTGGVARKGFVMSEDERRIVAYHEAGHAVVMNEIPQADPVYKVTIIPRGQMGGYTMSLPDGDRLLTSRSKLLAQVTGLLGGRAAEEIFFQDITNGASNDLNVATQLVEEMVMRLGMDSGAGLRVLAQQHVFSASRTSQKTFEAVDGAINTLLEDCYMEAKRILLEKREIVVRLVDELLEMETVDRERFMQLMNAEPAP